jgi:hypothetical protein
LDHDGYFGPLPGKKPGEPGACGDDCDDTNPNAHPNGIEICDGVDNDCNGVVDDNAHYVPIDADAVRIDGDIAPAGPGGIAWSGKSYASVYWGTKNGFSIYESMLTPQGLKADAQGEHAVTIKNADADGGPLVWIGDRYGMAWQDRRDGDYEVYFTLLDDTGAKALPDTRLTFADGFSINVSLGWNGSEFIVVWQDERDGIFNVFGQRVSVDGAPIGSNIQLTANDPSGLGAESPTVAVGKKGVGVSYSLGDAFSHLIQFQLFSPDLTQALSAPIQITDGSTDAVYPTVTFSRDRYVISWFDKTTNPKSVFAMTVSEDGQMLTPPTPITNPGNFHSRYPFLKALGDRVLVVYSDDRDQNDGYEIYSHMVNAVDLTSLGPEQRITNAKRDSVDPVATFGPDGNVGILFRDDRDGEHHIYFTRLACVAGTTP